MRTGRHISIEEAQRLTDKLREDVTKKREEYLTASRHYKDLLGVTQDLGPAHPDGQLGLKSASIQQTAAFAAYRQALQTFNALILNGKVPESPED